MFRRAFAIVFMAAYCSVGTLRGATPGAGKTFDQSVHGQITAVLDKLQGDGDFSAASHQIDVIFDQVAGYGTAKSLNAFRDVSFAMRLVEQVVGLPEERRLDLFKYLRANDNLAHELLYLMRPEQEAKGVFDVLDKLRVKHADQLDKYATLAAAICVVHDRPFTRQINENMTTSPDPVDIFEFYAKNESKMLFGIQKMPAELLMYVVDTTASISEMNWALSHYAGDTLIGKHFFDINYDFAYFESGKDKTVTKMGYTLPNILKYGGVCADQAYFAMSIGKAIGVPTAYTTGRSAEVGHAWVGFLQQRESKGVWNFDIGRYEEYRGIRGDVIDPQTRAEMPDSYISLQAELIGTKAADRQAAVALTDAAMRVASAGEDGQPVFDPAMIEPDLLGALTMSRKAGGDAALELLDIGVAQCVAYPRAWFLVGDLAQKGKLTTAQKSRWSDGLLRLCGTKYPDFAITVIEPMIGTINDLAEQNRLWNVVFNRFQGRADLAAEIRMYQAHMWEDQKKPANAGQCYMDVIDRYANAGPFVIDALAGAEKLLAGKNDKILQLYAITWRKITRPEDMSGPFLKQSNWYRVGAAYADKLRAAGSVADANDVMGQIDSATSANK